LDIGEAMKYCKKCDIIKNENEFTKDSQKKSGLCTYCKDCTRKRSAKQIRDNPNYYKNYAEKYREENRELLRQKAKEDFLRNKEKRLHEGRESYYRHATEIAKRRKIKRATPEAIEKATVMQREWRKMHPELYKSYIKKWQRTNRIKHAAHQAVHRAVKDGILKRSKICQECGKCCKTEGHHEDYYDTLNVIWLCRKCHASKMQTVKV
jgi:Bacillus phage endonuclease